MIVHSFVSRFESLALHQVVEFLRRHGCPHELEKLVTSFYRYKATTHHMLDIEPVRYFSLDYNCKKGGGEGDEGSVSVSDEHDRLSHAQERFGFVGCCGMACEPIPIIYRFLPFYHSFNRSRSTLSGLSR